MCLYFRIWADSITRLRSRETNKDNWQIKGMITMSLAMTFNFIFFMAIVQRNVIGYYFYKINLHFLSKFENSVLTILVLFLLPSVILNYLLIFRGKRYEKFIEKYPYYNGKLFLVYFLTSLFLPIILMWIGIYLYH